MRRVEVRKVEGELIDWLLEGDVSIQYQTYRDLLDREQPELRARIATEGWGAEFLNRQKPDGHWGKAYYNPKWTSSHYTILDLKNLAISPGQPAIRDTLATILEENRGADGGINPSRYIPVSDVCLSGMVLNFASYFGMPETSLRSIVDFLVDVRMEDGGFNCESNRAGAVHSSLHSTISILEGILEYRENGYSYRLSDLQALEQPAQEFILRHRLYRSHRTGEIIDKRMLLLSFPTRWYFDILRALDYFQAAKAAYDPRMQDALEVLMQKRRRDGTWPVQGKHPGQTHFEMEQTGKPSRWNTLRALRVFKHFPVLEGLPV